MMSENKWGIVKATAPPFKDNPCPDDLGSMGSYEAIIQFLTLSFPNIKIIKGLNNRVGLSKPPFILIQTFLSKRISTDETRYSNSKKFIKQYSKNLLRLDFYGTSKFPAADMAMRFRTLWNDDSTFDFFQGLKIPIFPLFADDIVLKPFVNSEDQYSDRFTCDAHFEYHPEIEIPQESATEIIFPVALANNK